MADKVGDFKVGDFVALPPLPFVIQRQKEIVRDGGQLDSGHRRVLVKLTCGHTEVRYLRDDSEPELIRCHQCLPAGAIIQEQLERHLEDKRKRREKRLKRARK